MIKKTVVNEEEPEEEPEKTLIKKTIVKTKEGPETLDELLTRMVKEEKLTEEEKETVEQTGMVTIGKSN